MITKEGYVFVARFENGHTPIFGKPIDERGLARGYDNITANMLTFFEREREMWKAMEKYEAERRRSSLRMIPANLAMVIAEKKEELDAFRTATDLVVVQTIKDHNWTDIFIYGPINQKFLDLHHGVLPCQRIDTNKLLTFKRSKWRERTFEVAMEVRYQVQRQSDNSPTTIGTFKLKKLEI